MNIVTVGGLIGTIELMRQYQKDSTGVSRKMMEGWQGIVDNFISDWNKDGINGSTPLFNSTAPQGGDNTLKRE
jgi:hypothetical protein